jgi:hypothetical protein
MAAVVEKPATFSRDASNSRRNLQLVLVLTTLISMYLL